MVTLDVVVVATRRPAILALTLASFRQNLLGGRFATRGIINVDPIGGTDIDTERCIDLARSCFDAITVRTPDTPSFAAAVQWGWSEAGTPWVLHLEDDWLLKRPIDVNRLAAEMEEPETAIIRLNLRRNPNTDPPMSGTLSLNPSFFRQELISRLLPLFDLGEDPEDQFRRLPGRSIVDEYRSRYHGRSSAPACVADIGKRWRRAEGIEKDFKMQGGTGWRRSNIGRRRMLLRMKSAISLRLWQIELATSILKPPV